MQSVKIRACQKWPCEPHDKQASDEQSLSRSDMDRTEQANAENKNQLMMIPCLDWTKATKSQQPSNNRPLLMG